MDIFGRKARRRHIEALTIDAKHWREKAESSERLFANYLRWDETRQRAALPKGPAREQAAKFKAESWDRAKNEAKHYFALGALLGELSDEYGAIKAQISGGK
jgi:hypothetical protein